MINLPYKPDNPGPTIAQNATLAVKFCNDIFLSKLFLNQRNIDYKIEDLEDGPWGLGIRIKRDKK